MVDIILSLISCPIYIIVHCQLTDFKKGDCIIKNSPIGVCLQHNWKYITVTVKINVNEQKKWIDTR